LNGDGDAEDRVVHVPDLDTGTTTNLELAPSGGGRILYGTRLFFRVREQGGQDLNGDGDSEDSVLHLHDLDTGTTTNLELAGRVSFSSGKWLAFAVSESEQGADLNGDGDSDDDSVLHVADWSTFSPLPSFLRGDCNSDGEVTGSVTDAVFLLEFNFLGGPRPPCLAACDANGDGEVTGSVTDAVYLLGFNFLGTAPPPGPFPHCRSVRALSALERDAALGCETVPECP
ncbi:MAG: dockerin type I repeat-containing protein, partial [Planctomycetota bacterium]|nr:dockerin type I repeat-containing protein [Planctomycetota bacterium]